MDDGRHTELDDDDAAHSDHVDVTALVLGHVDAQRRADMAAHLLVCSACRSDYDEMSAAVTELLAVVPAVQPPLGFDQQVLARIGISTGRRRTPPWRAWVAAAAAAILIASTVSVGRWATSRGDSRSTSDVSTLELADGGNQVGTVSIGDVRGHTVMVVALVAAPEGVSYRCRITFSDGTTTESEPWPAEYGAWIVPLPPSASNEIDTVELIVDGTDHVWSSASFSDES